MALPRMLAVLVVIGLVGLAGQVQAARIDFRFTGEVTQVPDNPQLEALGVVLGAPVFGEVLFSSEDTDLDPSPNIGDYRQIHMSIGIGQYSVGRESSGPPGITVLNDFEGRDEYRVNGGGPDNFTSFAGAEIFLIDPTATVFSSDALPLVLPALSEFATAEGRIVTVPGEIIFRLTSFNVVPEPVPLLSKPASLLLLSVALVGVGMLILRRAKGAYQLPGA